MPQYFAFATAGDQISCDQSILIMFRKCETATGTLSRKPSPRTEIDCFGNRRNDEQNVTEASIGRVDWKAFDYWVSIIVFRLTFRFPFMESRHQQRDILEYKQWNLTPSRFRRKGIFDVVENLRSFFCLCDNRRRASEISLEQTIN